MRVSYCLTFVNELAKKVCSNYKIAKNLIKIFLRDLCLFRRLVDLLTTYSKIYTNYLPRESNVDDTDRATKTCRTRVEIISARFYILVHSTYYGD